MLIKLDKERDLKFMTNSLIKIEQHFKMPIQKFFEGLKDGSFGLKEIRYLLWAGLVHEDPKLTEEKAGDLMDTVGMTTVAQYVGDALAESFGVSDKDKVKQGDSKN